MSKKLSHNRCAYFNCESARNKYKNLSFFSFPVKSEEKCKKWILNCGNKDLLPYYDNVEEVKNFVICEKHFIKTSFYDFSAPKKRLIKNAEPVKYIEEDPMEGCSTGKFYLIKIR